MLPTPGVFHRSASRGQPHSGNDSSSFYRMRIGTGCLANWSSPANLANPALLFRETLRLTRLFRQVGALRRPLANGGDEALMGCTPLVLSDDDAVLLYLAPFRGFGDGRGALSLMLSPVPTRKLPTRGTAMCALRGSAG